MHLTLVKRTAKYAIHWKHSKHKDSRVICPHDTENRRYPQIHPLPTITLSDWYFTLKPWRTVSYMFHWPKATVVLVGKWLEMETWIYGAPGIYGNTVTNVKHNIRTKVEVCKHTLNFIKPIIQRIKFNMHHMVPIFPTYTVNKPCPTSKQMLFPFQTHHVQIPAICFSRVSPYATQFSFWQVTHLFQQRSRFPGNKLIGSKKVFTFEDGNIYHCQLLTCFLSTLLYSLQAKSRLLEGYTSYCLWEGMLVIVPERLPFTAPFKLSILVLFQG